MTKTELERKTDALRVKIELASASTTDTNALTMIELFPHWTADMDAEQGKRYQHGGLLYRCRQAHRTQESWTPDITPSLWERVQVHGEGTHDNPIAYDANIGMALVSGLFYTEDGVLYECFRDTGVPVYNRLSDLVDIYVKVSN